MPTSPPPSAVENLLARIGAEYAQLSRQLKRIAHYLETQRDHIGLQGIQDVATQCDVQPSAVVRFAKHFGFSGFSALQAVFRESLSQQLGTDSSYQTRIRGALQAGGQALDPVTIAQTFLQGGLDAIKNLQQSLDTEAMATAVQQLANADTLWIIGARRSFPVAVYLDYVLQHTSKRVHLVSGLGHMQGGQVQSVRPGDVLIAISFAPYAEETLSWVAQARRQGARVLAITDSRMGGLVAPQDIALLVHDHATFGFRALTSTMALAQSLFMALACELELHYHGSTPPSLRETGTPSS